MIFARVAESFSSSPRLLGSMAQDIAGSAKVTGSYLIAFALLCLLVGPSDNNYLWRLPPLLKDLPFIINDTVRGLMFEWMPIQVYDPSVDDYESKPLFREITRAISSFVLAIIVFGAIGGIAGPAIQGMVAGAVDASDQGKIQGALTSLMSVTSIAAPLIFSAGLFAYFTSKDAIVELPGAPFLLGSALILIALMYLVRLFRRLDQS